MNAKGTAMVAGLCFSGSRSLRKAHQCIFELVHQGLDLGNTAMAIGIETSQRVEPALIDRIARNLSSDKRLSKLRMRA
ncbi:MAG: hypothetical protein HC794_04870 [Nitrospiraceae bacterium]|nr:hypothetical protein [Nitrospiraceae bacterium]